MIDSVTRRTFLAGSLTVAGLSVMGAATGQTDATERVCLWCGPDDPNIEAGNHAWFDTSGEVTELYIRFDGDTGWGDPEQLAASDLWSEHPDDATLLTTPDHDGVQISEARVGWAGLESFAEEEGTFDISSGGEQVVEFDNTYRFASPAVGANQGDGEASWYGWIRDADDYITGMEISYDTGTFSSAVVRWHVTGNQTQASYEAE